MGVFGEAIYGHVGQYEARVYNAQYIRSEDGRMQLVSTRGLSEQDAVNRMFGKISIGPQNNSSIVLALNTELKGHSWAVRTAQQSGSSVSGGFCHAVHSESLLSSLYLIDNFIYFPFIPNGEYCVSLIRDPASFSAEKRWKRNMQTIPAMREENNKKLGTSLNIPRDLLKRLTPYLVSQASINARQYLYIRVPDRAPYEPYCLAVLHEILSLIPAGLRAGISAATNCMPQEEANYGIIFQRASYRAGHPTDINLHVSAEYPFLDNVFISSRLRMLLEQIVDYPELTDKCFRSLEQAVFGDQLPESFQSYENYFGISTIQKDKSRPTYLEECSGLLETTAEPVLRQILERIILEEYRTPEDLESAISSDPEFKKVNSFAGMSAYLKMRSHIISFLQQHGIHFTKLFIFKYLNQIARNSGAGNVIDLYEKVVSEQQDLAGFSDGERSEIISDCHETAWAYLAKKRSGMQNGWNEQTALEQYRRICGLDERTGRGFKPPVSEFNWFNGCRRRVLLEQFKSNPSPENARAIFCSIPDIDPLTGKETCLTPESAELVETIRRFMESEMAVRVDPETAGRRIDEILAYSDVVNPFFLNWKSQIPDAEGVIRLFNDTCESALYIKALDYTAGSGVTGNHLSSVMQLAANRMPLRGSACIREIQVSVAERIRDKRIPVPNRTGLYQAAAACIEPELQKAYTEWVAEELRKNDLDPEYLRNLYETVVNPDPELQQLYVRWAESTSKTKDLLEKMKASRTLVKYLNILLSSDGRLTESDISSSRDAMWDSLTVQERTISSFTASIAYLYQKSAEVILSDSGYRKDAGILQEECRTLAEQYGLGIYLDPYVSLSELLENVRQFAQWTGQKRVTLYSENDLGFSNQTIVRDSEGSEFYSVPVDAETFHNTLRSLLCLLDNGDYSVPEGEKIDPGSMVDALTNNKRMAQIMKILSLSGIIGNIAGLSAVLSARGYQGRTRARAAGRGSSPGLRNIAAAAAALIVTFGLGMILSHFVWKPKPDPAPAAAANTEETTLRGRESGTKPSSNLSNKVEPVTEAPTEAPAETAKPTTAQAGGGRDELAAVLPDTDTTTTTTALPGGEGSVRGLPVYQKVSDTIGPYDPYTIAFNYRETAAGEINISDQEPRSNREEGQIFLPITVKEVKTDPSEPNTRWFAVKYGIWKYRPKGFKDSSSRAKLSMEDAEEDCWIGYLKTDSSGNILDKKLVTPKEYDSTSDTSTEVFPEEIPKKVQDAVSVLREKDGFEASVIEDNDLDDSGRSVGSNPDYPTDSIKSSLASYIRCGIDGEPDIEAVQYENKKYKWIPTDGDIPGHLKEE